MSNSLRPHGLQHARLPCPSQPLESIKLMSVASVMPSSHLILCRPLLLPPSVFPSIRVFYSESVLHIRGPKYWSFCFSLSPSSEYSGLISLRMDWLQSKGLSRVFSNTTVQNHQFFSTLGWTGCSPRDSQESSPTPQFKIINSSALSFLHSPTLTPIHDHWKNHSFD